MERMFSYSSSSQLYESVFKERFIDALAKEIYAHSIHEHNENETLLEHSRKTLEFSYRIVDRLKVGEILRDIFSNLYNNLALDEDFNHLISESFFARFLWKLTEEIIFFHDLGKINPNFQYRRLHNKIDLSEFNILSGELFTDSKHSKYSKFFLDILLTGELEGTEFYESYKNGYNEEKNLKILYILAYIGLILNSIVDRHHSKLKKIENLLDDRNEEYKRIGKIIGKIGDEIFLKRNELSITNFFKREEFGKIKKRLEGDYNLFCLYKLLYSLLVVSDYYATYSFYDNIPLQEIQLNFITENTLKEFSENFYFRKEYNRKFRSDETKKKIEKLEIDEISDINILRSKILLEASKNLNIALDKGNCRIFFLNVPTGGGKTNISMKLLLDILQHSKTKNLKRAHYVFPYVNIIDQNFKTIVETLTSSENQEFISKIYSYSEWDFSKKQDEEMEYFINQQFLNYPITIISNVNFFNSFIKNTKKSNYKVLNFVNSVIILDEIQSLPVNNWEYFSELLKEISEKYNIYFILMSATLPDLSRFVKEKTMFQNLINSPNRYQTHRCFLRTIPIFETEKVIRKDNYDYFIDHIYEERKNHFEKYIKVLCVVNTVQNSYDLYKYLENKLPADFQVLLLNSTILTQRRQEIIHLLNKKSEDLKRCIVLISTQSVEAGVDIDCNLGFREYSPLDSIEQISGRINREGNRAQENSKLFIFEMNTSSIVYGDDVRIKIQNQHKDEIGDILAKKKFDDFYNLVIQFLRAEESDYWRIFNEFKEPTYNLDFDKLSEYDYIDKDNITFFVPVKIDLDRFALLNAEMDYLKEKNIDTLGFLDGEEIWNLYEKITGSQFTGNKLLEIKKFQSILNKFTFSVHDRIRRDNKTLRQIVTSYVSSGEFNEIGGMIKISKENFEKLDYRIESGLNPSNLDRLWNS